MRKLKPYSIAFLIICLLVSFIMYTVQEPKASQIENELNQEFKAIAPLSNAKIIDFGTSHKTSNALVFATYTTTLSYQEILSYYKGELREHGWQFDTEKVFKDSSTGSIGKLAFLKRVGF